MTPLFAAYDIFTFLFVLVLPAMVIGNVLLPRELFLPRLLLGTVVVITLFPLAGVGLASAMGTSLREVPLYILASTVIVIGSAVQLVRYRKRTKELEG